MTKKTVSLVEMKPGETGKVVGFQGGRGMNKNLENMGIKIGAEIKKMCQQFMRGPVMIRRNNTTVAIGFGMARRIMVETKSGTKK